MANGQSGANMVIAMPRVVSVRSCAQEHVPTHNHNMADYPAWEQTLKRLMAAIQCHVQVC